MVTWAGLEAAAVEVIVAPQGRVLRHLLWVLDGGGEVRCAAVTLAEGCRGAGRARRVEAAVCRDRGGQRVRMVPTDTRLAKLVGAILHAASRGGSRMADAQVIAVCAGADVALVITADPGDVNELESTVPGTRVITRRPEVLTPSD